MRADRYQRETARRQTPTGGEQPRTADCRDCGHEVSRRAFQCPHCGAPRPAGSAWLGHGFEYKSRATLLGLPLVHISFKYRGRCAPVPAVGIIAIGQFGAGVITIAQFGVGVLTLAQVGVAGILVGQVGAAYYAIAQAAVVLHDGIGQVIYRIPFPG